MYIFFFKMLKMTKKVVFKKSQLLLENRRKSLIVKNIKDEFLQLSEKRIGSDLITVHKYCREEEASCIKWLESTEEGHNKNR